MKIKKKARKQAALPQETVWPTQERLKRGGIGVQDNVARAEEPLRIDRLLKNNVIDEMQHHYGLQFITLWTIAQRPRIRGMRYEPRIGDSRTIDANQINISRMNAEDQFYKVVMHLRPRDYALLGKICFEELPAIAAGRALGLPVNGITAYVRDAFDQLGEALVLMRKMRKHLERPAQAEEGCREEC
jgi:hypothetical protein